MILRGILNRSLGNQICVRGFARIKELARISTANPEYQRELIDKQIKLTSNFLTEETYLFFPEVILSLKLKYDLTQPKSKKDNTPIQLLENKKTFNSNVNSLQIKPIIKKANVGFDINESEPITIVEIIIDDIELNELIAKNQHPFHRIDGNHRLSAAEQIESGDRINLMNIPFCIVLFEEITSSQFSDDLGALATYTDKSYEKFERVVFYNINSKSEPLTLEENLKGILGEDKYFDSEEIDKIFNDNGTLARELGKRIIPKDFSSIKLILEKNKWALCLNIYKHYVNGLDESITKIDNKLLISKVFDSLQAINLLYRENKSLKNHQSIEMLTAFLYYKSFSSDAKFNFFSKWIINNHLFEAEETTSESIIRIFDKIYQKKNISVFVAMPYWSHQKVNEYNKLFKEALAEIQSKAKSNIVLDLIPIMRFKGASERIDKRLLDCIKKCDVFVADITECNPNVLFEVAYAEGSGKHKLLIKAESDDSVPPFDMDKMQWIPYDKESYYSSIKSILINNISAILTDNFDVHI